MDDIEYFSNKAYRIIINNIYIYYIYYTYIYIFCVCMCVYIYMKYLYGMTGEK